MTSRVVHITLLISILAATPAIAQTQQPIPRMDAGSATISGGYSRVTWHGCCANGFMIDFAYDLMKAENHAVGLLVDFSRSKSDENGLIETDLTFVGGVRVLFLRGRRVNIFAQGTAGIVNYKQEDAVALLTEATQPLIGGGFAGLFNLNEYMAIKLQWDFWSTKSGDQWEGLRRFVFGGVFRFGGR